MDSMAEDDHNGFLAKSSNIVGYQCEELEAEDDDSEQNKSSYERETPINFIDNTGDENNKLGKFSDYADSPKDEKYKNEGNNSHDHVSLEDSEDHGASQEPHESQSDTEEEKDLVDDPLVCDTSRTQDINPESKVQVDHASPENQAGSHSEHDSEEERDLVDDPLVCDTSRTQEINPESKVQESDPLIYESGKESLDNRLMFGDSVKDDITESLIWEDMDKGATDFTKQDTNDNLEVARDSITTRPEIYVEPPRLGDSLPRQTSNNDFQNILDSMQKEINDLKKENNLAAIALKEKDEKNRKISDSAKFDDLGLNNLKQFTSEKSDIKITDFPDAKVLADKIISGVELENDSRYFYFKDVVLDFEKKLIKRIQKMNEQTNKNKDDFTANIQMLEQARVDCFQDDCITKMNIINDAINRFRRLDRFLEAEGNKLVKNYSVQLNENDPLLKLANCNPGETFLYDGFLKDGTIKDGFGILKYSTKRIFAIGEFKNDNQTGKINYIFHKNNTVVYKGEMQNSLKYGKGKTYCTNGSICVNGQYDNNLLNGDNIEIFYQNKKLMYKGTIKNGLFENFGTLYWSNGNQRYKGCWSNGKIDGAGISLYYNNGRLEFEGDVKNGKPSGRVALYYENGSLKLEADLKQNQAKSEAWKLYNLDGTYSSIKYKHMLENYLTLNNEQIVNDYK